MGRKKQNEKVKNRNDRVDRISILPDNVLVDIMSHLNIKEAARTSVLSRSWIDLFKFNTTSLNLDGYELGGLNWSKLTHGEFVKHRPRFVDFVNQVLESQQNAPRLDEFRVRFDLGTSCPSDVEAWIDFASRKHVERLELNMSSFFGAPRMENCDFPSKSLANLEFKSLRTLRLKYIDVCDEDLMYFASGCPYLEELSVVSSKCLQRFVVDTTMPQLKHLEISHCLQMGQIQISAPNLLSFKYHGRNIGIPFKDKVLHLVEVSLGGMKGEFVEFVVFDSEIWPSRYLPEVEKLTLHLNSDIFPKFLWTPEKLLKLPILKQLDLEIRIRADHTGSMIWLTSMLEAYPSLYRLSVKLKMEVRKDNHKEAFYESVEQATRRLSNSARCEHSVRIVEVVGCIGAVLDVELLMCLLGNATRLEKITVSDGAPDRGRNRCPRVDWAAFLKPQLPEGADLIVL